MLSILSLSLHRREIAVHKRTRANVRQDQSKISLDNYSDNYSETTETLLIIIRLLLPLRNYPHYHALRQQAITTSGANKLFSDVLVEA